MNNEELRNHPTLRQDELRKHFLQTQSSDPWTIVYKSWRNKEGNGGQLAAFAPASYRSMALRDASWDLQIGDGAPGFCQRHENGNTINEYNRSPNLDHDIEPIAILQEHHGIKSKMYPQLSEEFRLFHNLWIDPSLQQAIKIYEDGNEEVAAEISKDFIKVKTKLLKQYQAARQLDLIMYIDSVVNIITADEIDDFEEFHNKESGEDFCYTFSIGDIFKEQYFSRFLAKKILPPPPVEKSGIWPFNNLNETYSEFIIGEDESGEPIKHSCEPILLSDYFGANPRAPHFLTPVFFKREVLQKYYEYPEKYSVEDGYLRCGSLWGLRIDNDHPKHVMVFLGDLGQSLPERERDSWKAFNITPEGKMSETVFKRSFLGKPTNPKSPDLIFKSTYINFCQSWKKKTNWDFFKPLHDDDLHVFSRIRIPLNNSQPEFETQISNLTKLLVDALNEDQLVKEIGSQKENEKGIGKLQRWLELKHYPDIDKVIPYLKRLQRLRSKVSAHKKSSSHQQFLDDENVNSDKQIEVSNILLDATKMLVGLNRFFE